MDTKMYKNLFKIESKLVYWL